MSRVNQNTNHSATSKEQANSGRKESSEVSPNAHPLLRERMRKLLSQLTTGIHERNEIMAVSLLGAIAGHNTFLFGPPGTAKSLISRRLASAFDSPRYFEILMNRFSTPEEVFGPVSIKHLKEDLYIRQIEDYLPSADFAFLDEIWKSSPAILNSLLTIINERIYKNGNQTVKVPLKSLVAASNEVPQEHQGLDALYDRFIIRLQVPPIQLKENFHHLLDSHQATATPEVDSSLRISSTDIETWRKQLLKIRIGKETFNIIDTIRQELASKFDDIKVYVSDRRWQRAADLMKASAYFNGRTETNHADAVLLKHCLWNSEDNRKKVQDIIMSSIEHCGLSTTIDLSKLDEEKNLLEQSIQQYIFHDKDVYETITLGDGNEYFEIKAIFEDKHYNRKTKPFLLYTKADSIKQQGDVTLIHKDGTPEKQIKGDFDGQGVLTLKYHDSYQRNTWSEFTWSEFTFRPKVQFRKGSRKNNLDNRLILTLKEDIKKITKALQQETDRIENEVTSYRHSLESPFITQEDSAAAISSILNQVKRLKQRIEDCKRLESLCE